MLEFKLRVELFFPRSCARVGELGLGAKRGHEESLMVASVCLLGYGTVQAISGDVVRIRKDAREAGDEHD